MTAGYINFNDKNGKGRDLRAALTGLKEARDNITYIFNSMQQMIDGDSSDPASFTVMQAQFTFDDNAGAKACFDELNADVIGQLNSTGVKAALDQLFAKLG